MICHPCRDKATHHRCPAVLGDRTWCDCQHGPGGNLVVAGLAAEAGPPGPCPGSQRPRLRHPAPPTVG